MAPENPKPRRDDELTRLVHGLLPERSTSWPGSSCCSGPPPGICCARLRRAPTQPAPAAASRDRALHAHRGQRQGEAGGRLRVGRRRPQHAAAKNDLVRTGAGSTAEISFFDGTVVQVRPDSLITIEESSEDPATKRRRVAVADLVGRGELRDRTPQCQRELHRGRRRPRYASRRARSRRATSGWPNRATARRATVPRHQPRRDQRGRPDRAGIERGPDGRRRAEPRRAKVVLPATPALEAPPHEAEISYPDPTKATTLLTWKPVPDAASYRVMLDYSPYFNRPVVDQGGIRDSSVELRGLEAGSYYWKVAALTADRSRARSRRSRVSWSRATSERPPSGASRRRCASRRFDVRTNILQIKGDTAAGSNGHRQRAARRRPARRQLQRVRHARGTRQAGRS